MPAGRPSRRIEQEDLDKVEMLAAQGLAEYQIASMLDMCNDTFIKKKKEFPELVEYIKRGKAKGVATISNALFQKAKKGDNTSMIFYLCNRDPENWQRHDKPPETDDTAAPVAVNINVTDASKRDS